MTGRLTGSVAKFALLALFVAITNHGVLSRAEHFWMRGDALALAVFSGIWILALGGLCAAALLPGWKSRLFWAGAIGASTVLGEFAYSVTGAHLKFYDVVLYWAERAHWGGATETYAGFIPAALLEVAVGVVAILLPPRIALRAPRLVALAPAVPLLVVVALLLSQGGRGTRALPQQYNTLAMGIALAVHNPLDAAGVQRSKVALEPGPRRVRHVVLVVDESVRADFIDLNGAAGVTPFLESRAERVANFGYAVAANNCSLFANLSLRYGGEAESLTETVRSGPSIWSYARAAGFATVYLDAQRTRGALQNGMTVIERSQIDEHVQFDDVDALERDLFAARALRDVLRRETPHFVYLNKRGAHIPYSRSYPPEARAFEPDMRPGEAVGASRERLLNSYRNALLWTVDGFFRELLADPLGDAVVIYTSDHGQNLMDRGTATHCSSSDPHVHEGLVPLLIASGNPTVAADFEAGARANFDRASHFELFPTLLELFGYEPAQVEPAYGPALFEPLPERALRFSYGPIAGFPGQAARWQDMPADLRALGERPR